MLKDRVQSTPIETDDERERNGRVIDPLDDADTLSYSRVDRRGDIDREEGTGGGALGHLLAPLVARLVALLQALRIMRVPLPEVPPLPSRATLPIAVPEYGSAPGRTAMVAAAQYQLVELANLLKRERPDRLQMAVLTGLLLRTPLGTAIEVNEARNLADRGRLVGPTLAQIARCGTASAAQAAGERARMDLVMTLDGLCAAESVTACAPFIAGALRRRVADILAHVETCPAPWAHLAPLAREILGYCAPLPGDPAGLLWAALAEADHQEPAPAWPRPTIAGVGHAAVLALVLGACGGPLEPVKRTLELKSSGEGYALTLVFPGLHVHHAHDLLTQDAASHGERLACAAPQVRLVSAAEETSPPGKDAPEGAPPKSSTKIEGVLVCQATNTAGVQ